MYGVIFCWIIIRETKIEGPQNPKIRKVFRGLNRSDAPHAETKKILTQKFICLEKKDKNKNKGSKAKSKANK